MRQGQFTSPWTGQVGITWIAAGEPWLWIAFSYFQFLVGKKQLSKKSSKILQMAVSVANPKSLRGVLGSHSVLLCSCIVLIS